MKKISVVFLVVVFLLTLVKPVSAKSPFGETIVVYNYDDPRCVASMEVPSKAKIGGDFYGKYYVKNTTDTWIWYNVSVSSNMGGVNPFGSRLSGYPGIPTGTSMYIREILGTKPYRGSVTVSITIEGEETPCLILQTNMVKVNKSKKVN